MRHLQHKLPPTTEIRKLMQKLRTRTSEPMSIATYTLQTTSNDANKQNGSKITAIATEQSLQLSRFDDQSHLDKQTYQNQDQSHKYHHPTMTLPLPLKTTTAQVVETSVTNHSLSKDYLHPDDHVKQITDAPGLKPFLALLLSFFT